MLKGKIRIASIVTCFVILLFTVSVAALSVGLIAYILQAGLPYVNWNFLATEPDILMDSYGIKPMIINTIYTVVLTLIICIPLGIGSAIYLAEYAKQGIVVAVILSIGRMVSESAALSVCHGRRCTGMGAVCDGGCTDGICTVH